MANKKLPRVPIGHVYYTVFDALLVGDGRDVFKAVIAGANKQAWCRVFRLKEDRKSWEELKGDWNDFNKPNTLVLEQDGPDLLISLSIRESGPGDYPSETFIAEGVCKWFEEDATPLNGGDYVTDADLARPLNPKLPESHTADGTPFAPVPLRITKQLRSDRQWQRYARFRRVLR